MSVAFTDEVYLADKYKWYVRSRELSENKNISN